MATDLSDTDFAGPMEHERGNLILTQVLGFKFSAYQVRHSSETYQPIWLTLCGFPGAGYGPERGYKRSRSNSERVDAGHGNPDKTSIRADTRHHALRTLVFPAYIMDRFVDSRIYATQLTPDDKAMENLSADFSAKVRREMGGSGNALSRSGALVDDDAPAAPTDSTNGAAATNMTSEEIENLPKQRVMLCESLLAIGHLPAAFFMLSKWPVMAQSSEVLADLILRIIKYAVEPAYQTIARSEGAVKSGPNYRMHFPFSVPEPTLTMVAPEPPSTEKKRFMFFYDGWRDGIPRWTQIEEVVSKVTPFANFIGPHGARDISVLVWLCRIGVAHQETDVSFVTPLYAHSLRSDRFSPVVGRCPKSLAGHHSYASLAVNASVEGKLQLQHRDMAAFGTNGGATTIRTLWRMASCHFKPDACPLYARYGRRCSANNNRRQENLEENDHRLRQGARTSHW